MKSYQSLVNTHIKMDSKYLVQMINFFKDTTETIPIKEKKKKKPHLFLVWAWLKKVLRFKGIKLTPKNEMILFID